jgi:hypothetical protein
MYRLFDNFLFVAVLESHKDEKWPHLHGFTNTFMRQAVWSNIWESCGGGRVVWIEKVSNSKLSEYVSKQINVAKYVGKQQLVDGYRERRKNRTLWRSNGLKAKYELTTLDEWTILKEPVYKESGELSDYYAKRGVWSNGKDERQR